ncbi:hypothetical protein [Hellea balneolensis]|uniref:hypothetical protein n=1 Tax=Hellea balneolensis TaxID=287478 RepID=UPI0004037B69|nr:hypothetical protein [Hellea balneolensis]
MKNIKKIMVVTLGSALIAPSAFAVDQDVRFSGVVLDSCALVIGTNGILGQSIDQTVLSSKETAGLPGTVTVTTNSINSNIQVIAPTSFDVGPASADTNTTFAASYTLAGDTVLSEVSGDSVTPLGLGVTVATVDANATKSTGTFDAGIYELVTVVRCTAP